MSLFVLLRRAIEIHKALKLPINPNFCFDTRNPGKIRLPQYMKVNGRQGGGKKQGRVKRNR